MRIEHIPSEDGLNHDAGPGWSLAVDPDSWEAVDVPLESESEMGNGYRYYQLVEGRPVYSPVG